MIIWSKRFGTGRFQSVSIELVNNLNHSQSYCVLYYHPVQNEYPANIEDIRWICKLLNSGAYSGVDDAILCKEILG